MIEIANIENSSIVEITISDKLNKKDIGEIDDFFTNKVSEQEKINVLLLMNDWQGLTIKGLIEDFKMVKHIKNMDKVAIVADSKLLKADSKLEDLFPGIRVSYFTSDEQDAAKKWLEA